MLTHSNSNVKSLLFDKGKSSVRSHDIRHTPPQKSAAHSFFNSIIYSNSFFHSLRSTHKQVLLFNTLDQHLIVFCFFHKNREEPTFLNKLFFPITNRTCSLIGRHYQHFCNLNMWRNRSCIIHNLGNVIACKRANAFIHSICLSLITAETYH